MMTPLEQRRELDSLVSELQEKGFHGNLQIAFYAGGITTVVENKTIRLEDRVKAKLVTK